MPQEVFSEDFKKTSLAISGHYYWGTNCEGWHLLKNETLSVKYEKIPSGSTEILHFHRNAQQFFYILSGKASFEINGIFISAKQNESVEIKPRVLHRIFNDADDDILFLVISEPSTADDRIELISYDKKYQADIKSLNEEWLEKYFRLEPGDKIQLSDPQKYIIDKGGFIFFARINNDIRGTASLLKVNDGVFELGKMAVTATAQGLGIGDALLKHSINEARHLNIKKLVLYSNRKLKPAIHLYNKHGFTETLLEAGHYERADIKMEKNL